MAKGDMSCENCYFSKGEDDHDELGRGSLFCIRYPRVRIQIGEYHDSWLSVYPEHNKDDWCGEYQSKDGA